MSKLYWGAGTAVVVAIAVTAYSGYRPVILFHQGVGATSWAAGAAVARVVQSERVIPDSAKETEPTGTECSAPPTPEAPPAPTLPREVFVWGGTFPELTGEESTAPPAATECPEKDCCKKKSCCGENGCKADKSCCEKSGCADEACCEPKSDAAECGDENPENGWVFDVFQSILRNASNAVSDAAAVTTPADPSESGTEESEMKDGGQAPDCTESPEHAYRYPGCPYIGASSHHQPSTAGPQSGILPKTKTDETILVPVPEELGGGEESEAAPKKKPSLDTMDFRHDEDAKDGEFDQKPMK
jgi:hypothetical protein